MSRLRGTGATHILALGTAYGGLGQQIEAVSQSGSCQPL
jgi:hypothetical protein